VLLVNGKQQCTRRDYPNELKHGMECEAPDQKKSLTGFVAFLLLTRVAMTLHSLCWLSKLLSV